MRAAGPPPRPPLLVQGIASAAVCGALAGLAAIGQLPLLAGVLLVQLILVLGFLALVDAPGSGGAFVIAVLATVVADGTVWALDGRVSGLAGVVALALVAALLHQLGRRARVRVTESLAYTLTAVVLSVGVASLVALRMSGGGRATVLVCLSAAAAALLAGRLGDLLGRRPPLATGSTRGWSGLVLCLAAGTATAYVVAGIDGEILGIRGALLGLAVAAAAAAADLAVDLGAAALSDASRDARRAAALLPVGLLLPLAALAPVGYVAGRLVFA
ncbi:MAG: hypothetical protein JWN35_3448 [Frankiales bacterium]|nr:hypothetical protein [Frankiales bacterium]